jgi:hypothetical protein
MGISLGRKLDNSLRDLLRHRKDFLLNHWYQRMLDEYAGGTASFLRGQTDRFANPVAFALKAAAEAIYQALINDRDVDRGALEYAIKIKAVQEDDPSKAVAFILLLKETVRDVLGNSVSQDKLADFNARIDQIAFVASEMFILNRAKIAEIAGRGASRRASTPVIGEI